ncbi:hypothetical protein T12_10419 [Trichinella patagoniensis]|uniref:Peptidase A2 domain-containing protein n=2 Tax=Trichinella patagoniensis TaxID=990121 RepID=A0A0V0Z0P8_9BILA|nr:hypothetical protein T12_10419 [Trichinella patagoniensis]
MDSAIQERLTARLGDHVNDYEVLKAGLKKLLIPLKSEMSLRAEFCLLRQRPGEPVDAFAIRELTGALNRLITRLDDRLPPRERTAKPSLTSDMYQRKHPATIEARLEKLEEYYMRNRGIRTSREHPQPSRRLEGSTRKAVHPLASATDVVISDTPVINGKIRGFPIQFLLDSGAAMSIISKEVWDKLDVKDQGDAGLSQQWVLRLGRKGATLNAGGAVSVQVVLGSWTHRLPFVVAEDLSFPGILGMNFINECVEYIHAQEKYLKMRDGCQVKIARRRGPPGAMRCGETVGITDSVETAVITTLVSKATDCTDRSREKMADLLRRYAETISMSDDDLGHTSVVKHRIIVEGAKPIKQALRRLPI